MNSCEWVRKSQGLSISLAVSYAILRLQIIAVYRQTIGTLSIDDDEVGGRRPEVVEAT